MDSQITSGFNKSSPFVQKLLLLLFI